jgi:single-stranded-DNA-specific exonuclease
MRWIETQSDPETVNVLVRENQLHHIAAILLVQRNLLSAEQATAFLEPRLRDMSDPFLIQGLEDVVVRLIQAIQRQEKVLIFGDYDVDGVTSTTILVDVMRRFGLQPDFIVPRRLEEGYGLSMNAIERALSEGAPDLFIAVDCGTNSVEEIAYLRQQGIDVIVIDHHQSKDELPADCILVNPHVRDEENVPWKYLCAVGLVFKVVHGLIKRLRQFGDKAAENMDIRRYLDLVAMGTIADLVPLTQENRILACQGMSRLQYTGNQGLQALFLSVGLSSDRPLQPVDISFRISPRINASGRLADASLPINLLLENNFQRCLQIASELDEMNRERQEIERKIVESAESLIESTQQQHAGLVLFDKEWHPGVVGVVANRISRKYHRPCIVLGAEGDLAKGSGRTVRGMSLVDILSAGDHLLESWGGHPMAVGVSLKQDNVAAFQSFFNQAVVEALGKDPVEPELEIACEIGLEDLNEELLETLSLFHPFGQGNPEPVFVLRKLVLKRTPEKFGQDHIRFQIHLPNGNWLAGVGWKMLDNPLPSDVPVDIAFRFRWNYFNGRRYPQVELEDWKLSS